MDTKSLVETEQGLTKWQIRYRRYPSYRQSIVDWRKLKMDTDPEFRARMNMLKRESRKRCKERKLKGSQGELTEPAQ